MTQLLSVIRQFEDIFFTFNNHAKTHYNSMYLEKSKTREEKNELNIRNPEKHIPI